MAEKKFSFEASMQDDILKLCVRDSLFAEAATHWVKPKYFEGEERAWVSRFCNEFMEEYGMPPTASEVKQGLKSQIEKGLIKKAKVASYEEIVDKVLNEPLEGVKEYTTEQVKEFAQHRAWEKAIVDALPLMKKGKFAQMADLMESAKNSVFDLDSGGYWYFETLAERSKRRSTGEDELDVIPIGIMELDEMRRKKGLSRGEACCWLGPKGGGKSIALGHVTRRAIFNNRKVAYFSFEMDDLQNADRLDSGFTGVPIKEVKHKHELVLEKLKPIATRFPRSLFIKRYPTKGASIRDMHRCLQNLERSHKWVPDMIVMDYLTIAKPPRKREKRSEEIAELSEEFRWLLGYWGCPGHTAAQLNRSGAKKRLARGTEIAGAWDALATFDVIYTINQDDDERADGVLRIYIDKDRDGTDKIEVGPIYTAWDRMCFAVRPHKMPWEVREDVLYGRV